MNRWRFIAISIFFTCWISSAAMADDAPTTRPTAAIQWLTTLDSAYLLAQRTQQPIFVFVEDRLDAASQKQADAIDSADVAANLSSCISVRLEFSESKESARSLGVSVIPAMRLLAADGHTIASANHYLSPDALVKWLKTNTANAAAKPSDDIASLGSADPATRELSIRRLRDNRGAAGAVIDLLEKGNMTARLASLDLLEQWGSPVGGIDPWNPETINADRLKALRAWARSPAVMVPSTMPSAEGAADVGIELDALLSAPTDAASRAVRERLVRYGESILPEIYSRLKITAGDASLQRLGALRYRVVATDRLAGQWPGGFDRLASRDPSVRRNAVSELAGQIQSTDARLLVELFSDDDEFVREKSLKLLRQVGGPQTNQALIKLLADPEPNVRAAVLKTLAAEPDASLTNDLVRYVATEKDADLVVHAIHVLQDIPGDVSMKCLKDLLSHPEWRVRAEACEAIRQKWVNGRNDNETDDPAVVAALVKCMDDSDSFVASSAAMTMALAKGPVAQGAMIKALEHHPDLTFSILSALKNDARTARMLLPQIRKLTTSTRPSIRSMAITAVCQIMPKVAGAELKAGMEDPDESVRKTSATAFVNALQMIFPTGGSLQVDPGSGDYSGTQSVDPQAWAADFRSGTGRPRWMATLQPDLETLLTSPDPQTKAAAAVGLCAIGQQEKAWPVIQKLAKSPAARSTDAEALCWLDWDQRTKLFDQLTASADVNETSWLARKFVEIPDVRAAPQVWNLLKAPERASLASAIDEALDQLFHIERYGNPPTVDNTDAVKSATEILATGNDIQKTVALCLLFSASQDAANDPAMKLYNDPQTGAALREDAFHILLLNLPAEKADPLAVAAISDEHVRRLAVTFLAEGNDELGAVHSSIYLYRNSSRTSSQSQGIIDVPVPAGLTIPPLENLLHSPDQSLAGYAGYLVAIQGDKRGLEPLIKAMKASEGGRGESRNWAKLVYRAISKLNDDSQTPVLEEIYKGFEKQDYEMREFYWTIRAIKGPNIMKLRKKIRDEVAPQYLQ